MANPKCFVAMPITTPDAKLDLYDDNDNHFLDIVEIIFRPALAEAGFDIISPASKGSNLIHADIINNLATCELVLCDMSTSNSNVFFELGIRCALNLPVVLVVDDKTDYIPFDTSIINYYTYSFFWADINNQIHALATHIKNTVEKTPNFNALWKYFGISNTAQYDPNNITKDEKLDMLLNLLTKPGTIQTPSEKAFDMLSNQEKLVLFHISQGKKNREIAEILLLRDGTVRNYVSSILAKLGLGNRSEATAYAIKNGLKDVLNKSSDLKV